MVRLRDPCAREMTAAFGKGADSLLWVFEGSKPLARSLLPASFFAALVSPGICVHRSEAFWGLVERVKMLLKVLPGLLFLPRVLKAHPCELQVLLQAVTHSLHTWVRPQTAAYQPGGAAAQKHTKCGSRPGVESLLLDIHGDLVAGARIHSVPARGTRGKAGAKSAPLVFTNLSGAQSWGK